MCTSRYNYQAPSSMLRARRRDANVRPNRWLDKKSSRGMLFENEELRLRTIEINAEVERGQGDIKKLKRQNDQLRREIWTLRDEYDKLEERMRRMRRSGARSAGDEDDEEYYDEEQGEEQEEEEEEEEEEQAEPVEEKQGGGAEDDDNRQNAHLASAKLGLAGEEKLTIDEAQLVQCEERGPPDVLLLTCNGEQQGDSGLGGQRDTDQDTWTTGTNQQDTWATGGQDGGSDNRTAGGGDVRTEAGGWEDNREFTGEPRTVDLGSEFSTTADAWWLLAPLPVSAASQEPPWQSSDAAAMREPSWQLPPATREPWAQWALQPYREPPTSPAEQQFTPRQRRRAPPPPPPPKPTCEQVATVRRASSVLPDGTTRRSVTFHADSVTYIPHPAQRCPCHEPRTCFCNLPAAALGSDAESTLLVRGLERVPGLAACELIDALERRLGPSLPAVRGVCLHQARPAAPVVAATVSVAGREVALRLLALGLEARGETLALEEEEAESGPGGTRWRGAGEEPPGHVLLVSGVTHQVSDAAVRAAVLRASGLRASHVRRHVYKGVDTGERLVRVTPPCHALSLLTEQQRSTEGTESSKYRSHLNVQLRRPNSGQQETPGSEARVQFPGTEARSLQPGIETRVQQPGAEEHVRPAVRPATLQLPQNELPPPPGTPSTPGGPVPPPSPQTPRVLHNGPVAPPPYTPPPAVSARRPSVCPRPADGSATPREESPTKQRASVNFEERVGKKKSSSQQNGGILRRADDPQGRRAAKSRSVSVESSPRVAGGGQRRRHGVFERPSSDELLLEGRGSENESRDGSSRHLAVVPTGGPSLPWCACWGNSCI